VLGSVWGGLVVCMMVLVVNMVSFVSLRCVSALIYLFGQFCKQGLSISAFC